MGEGSNMNDKDSAFDPMKDPTSVPTPGPTKKTCQLITQYMAEFEGKITAAWYKTRQETGRDLGEAEEDNIYFMCFYAGATEGSLINNKTWMDYLQDGQDDQAGVDKNV